MTQSIESILKLPDATEDALLARIERLMRMGSDQQAARESAAQALYDEALAETAEMEQLIREQHPDLFLGATRRVVDQTETPAFKRWFGDSKVVDAQGKPLVMYHGAKRGVVDAFAPAAYFTEDPQEASDYAGRGPVQPVYITIKRPYEASDEIDEESRSELTEIDEGYAEELAARGYDGVVARRGGVTLWAIPFKPEQIKSAIGNNGQFDPENPDIRYSLPALESELQAINRSLKKVNPASAVAAMTGRAAKVIRAWSDLPPTELAKNLPLPIGPQPHVLHMLGAPMQALQINTSILRKVLLDRGKTASLANQDERDGKHANEFVGVSPEDFIASIYRPMVVMRGNVKGEFEVLLPLLSKQTGQPLMMAFITDAESGKIKSTAIKSSYGDGKLLAELPSAVAASRNGRLLYADLGLMESVMGKKNPAELSQGGAGSLPLGDRAVSTGPSITDPLAVHFGDLARTLDANLSPQVSPGGADGRLNTGPRIARPPSDKFTLLMTNIQRAINNRSVLGYGDLINFIASNYTGPGQDMPRFSRSSNQGFELPEFTNMRRVQQNMQDRYNRWKQAVDAVREQGGAITEANDFYTAEERYWGRVGTQVEDFGEEIKNSSPKLANLTWIRIQVRDVLNAWNETFDIFMRDHAKTKETPQ